MRKPSTVARALAGASIAALAFVACTPDKPPAEGTPAPVGKQSGSAAAIAPSAAASAAPSAAAAASDSAAPVASAAGSAAASAAADTLPAQGVPAIEDSCTTDADCGFTTLPVSGKHVCCDNQCGMTPVTKAYAARLAAACSTMNAARGANKAKDCPTLACDAMKSPKPTCKAGKCSLW